MLVASLDQGSTGISCPRNVLGFCLHLECEYFKHSSQLTLTSQAGHSSLANTLYLCLWAYILPRPKCPSCMSCNVAWHFFCGTTIQVPFKTTPSSTASSSLKVQYGCISLGTSLMVLDHPCVMVCLTSASSSSSWVAILTWFKLSLLALNWLVIWCICNFGSLMVCFCSPSWDKQSASLLIIPGIYLTVKWYVNGLISIRCYLGVAWFKLLDNMASRGCWSVSNIKWLAYRNDGISPLAKATASILIQLPHNLSGHCWELLLAKYTGLWSCSKQAPKPLTLASVCKIVCFLGCNMWALAHLKFLSSSVWRLVDA